MGRVWLAIIFLLPYGLFAQNRFTTLTVKSKQTYRFGASDIIVADTLVMMDSSRIELNSRKIENFIRVKVAIFGANAVIAGNGASGYNGGKGLEGTTQNGPCRGGTSAGNGIHGEEGAAGTNLFLYIDQIIVNGNLVIDLSGGNGGDGGDGGTGGGGSPGTLLCYGGNGGSGGNGGNGGDGGKGGMITFSGLDLEKIRSMVGSSIMVNTLGGNFGYWGMHGPGGPAGLGPSKMNGKAGVKGKDGVKGKPGKNGLIQFEQQ
jgi:hypothetical protein